MQTGQGNTGVQNTQYDLVSVMYHALQGGQTYSQYISDAQQSGDQELAQFFQQMQQEDEHRAQRAMQLLLQRAGQSISNWSSMGQSGMGQTSTR
jgi:hypothetical protein